MRQERESREEPAGSRPSLHAPPPTELTVLNLDQPFLVVDRAAETGAAALEPHLARMLAEAPVLMWAADSEGRRTFVNAQWCAWTGRAVRDEMGHGWLAGVHPDDIEHCLSRYRAGLEDREPFAVEVRLRRADGSYRWMIDRGTPLVDATGKVSGFVGASTDITELKDTQQELHRTHDRLMRVQAVAEALTCSRSFRELQRTQRRLELLAEASRRLAESLEPGRTAEALVDLIVPDLADWCIVYRLRGQVGEVAALGHGDPAGERLVELLRGHRPQLSDPAGVGAVLRTGATLRGDRFADALAGGLPDPQQDEVADLGGAVVVGLTVRGRVIGALVLANACSRDPLAGGRAGAIDDGFLDELATRAATALDNARLFAERSHVARCLQDVLLPPSLPRPPGLELGARYVAAGAGTEVGGDFYDVFAPERGRWVLAIGDVRGKGVEAAGTTGLARHVVRTAAVDADSPAVILWHLNEALLRSNVEHPDEDHPEPRFCTACVVGVTPSPVGARVIVSSAGHQLPVVVDAGGRVRPIGASGTLAGVVDDPVLVDVIDELRVGDALVCVTDGVTERHAGGRFFEDAFPAVLAAGRHLGAQDLAAHIEQAARAFVDGPLTDDMAILVLRVPPEGPGR